MVNFVQRLRAEIKFTGIDQLVEQIQQDIADASKILAPYFE
jgi:riboflavin kinase/FMN adenylyltransferase